MSIEQLSRELGDSRRAIASMVDQARAIASQRAVVASKRLSASPELQSSFDDELRQLTLRHSSLIAEAAIKAVESESLEDAMLELRYSQN